MDSFLVIPFTGSLYISRVKVLLLDVDGVLVQSPSMFSQHLKRSYRPNSWTFNLFYRYIFRLCLLGKVDIRSVLPFFLKVWRYPGTTTQFLQEWFEFENHPDTDLLQHINLLHNKGWKIHLATNQEAQRVKYILYSMKFHEFSAGEFSSATIGARKPGSKYFKRVTQRLGILPQDIIFWDDSKTNVRAAQEAGWTAYHYKNAENFAIVMANHNP